MSDVQRWQLELGGEVIAQIDADDYEFPWTYGNLINSPQFERFRPYFTDDRDWPEEGGTIDALCSEIQSKGEFLLGELKVTGRTKGDGAN